MKIALVFGDKGEGVKNRLNSLRDNLVIDVYPDIVALVENSSQRRYYFSRILIVSSIIGEGDLDVLHGYWTDQSRGTEIVVICNKATETLLAEQIIGQFGSFSCSAMLLKSTTLSTLSEAVSSSITDLNKRYSIQEEPSFGVVEDMVELQPEIPEQSVQPVQPVEKPKASNPLKIFGSKFMGNFSSRNKHQQEPEFLDNSDEIGNTDFEPLESYQEPTLELTQEEPELPSNTDFEEHVGESIPTENLDVDSQDSLPLGMTDLEVENIEIQMDFDSDFQEEALSALDTDFDEDETGSSFEGFSTPSDNASFDTGFGGGGTDLDIDDFDSNLDLEDTGFDIEDDDIDIYEDGFGDLSNESDTTYDEVELDIDIGDIDIGALDQSYRDKVSQPEVVEKIVEVEKIVKVPEIVEKIVEVEKVVERVVEKEVPVSGRAKNTLASIARGTVSKLIIVTGDRGSGVTSTALEFTNFLTKMTNVLYFDADVDNHGLLNYIDYEQFSNYDDTHMKGVQLSKNARAFNNCVVRMSKNLDILTTNYGIRVTDDELETAQSVVGEVSHNYGVVVVDVPFDKLHLFQDLILQGNVVVCVEGSKRGYMNTIGFLERSEISTRFKRNIVSRGTWMVTKAGNPRQANLKPVIKYVDSIVEFGDINWLNMRTLIKPEKMSKDFINDIVER